MRKRNPTKLAMRRCQEVLDGNIMGAFGFKTQHKLHLLCAIKTYGVYFTKALEEKRKIKKK